MTCSFCALFGHSWVRLLHGANGGVSLAPRRPCVPNRGGRLILRQIQFALTLLLLLSPLACSSWGNVRLLQGRKLIQLDLNRIAFGLFRMSRNSDGVSAPACAGGPCRCAPAFADGWAHSSSV